MGLNSRGKYEVPISHLEKLDENTASGSMLATPVFKKSSKPKKQNIIPEFAKTIMANDNISAKTDVFIETLSSGRPIDIQELIQHLLATKKTIATLQAEYDNLYIVTKNGIITEKSSDKIRVIEG